MFHFEKVPLIIVIHLLKTSRKSHFWLFEYDAPFERERNPLYNDI